MTRGGRRRGGSAMTCLSCGALLDSLQSFCDDQCDAFAQKHGYAHYSAAKMRRGFPVAPQVRKGYRPDSAEEAS